MNYFTFDGIDSRTYNTYIATSNAFDAPGREDEIIKVPGSNNIYYLTEGTYKPFDIKLYCYIPSNMQVKTDDLRNFLLSKGTCTYTEAIRPNEFRVARFIEAYELDVSDRVSAAFVLTFKAQPQRYLTTNTPITTTATADTTTDTTLSLSTVPTPITISLNGNTTQEGSSGKNKLPIEAYTGIPYNPSAGATISPTAKPTQWTNNGDGTFKMTLTSWEQASLITAPLTAGRYVARVTTVTAGMRVGIYVVNADGTANRVSAVKNGTTANEAFQVATTLTAGQYFAFYIAGGSGECTIKEPMVEAGSTATAYEPHISPTNPQVIHNVSGDNKVIIASKNLLSNDWDNDWQRGYWDISTGKFVSSRNWQAIKYYIPVKPNTTYYVYADASITASIGNICQYDANKNFIVYKAGAKNTTFTTSANVYFLTIYVGNPYKNTNISLTESDITTNGTFVPFTAQSYPIYLPVENLFDFSTLANMGTNVEEIENGYRFTSMTVQYSTGAPITVNSGLLYIKCKIKNVTGKNLRVRVGYTDNTYNEAEGSGQTTDEWFNFSMTTNASKTVNSIRLNWSTRGIFEVKDFMVSYYNTVNFYPYGTTPIELNKIGTYQDYIYKNGGKWYLHKAIGISTINDIPWVYSSGSALFYATLANMTPAGLSRSDALCSTYPFNSGDDKFIATTSTQLRLIDSSYIDVASLKSAMGDVEIYYQLATRTNTEITDTTLINQLNNIEKAYSYNGTTNILQVSNDNGFMLEVVSLHSNDVSSAYKGEPIITVNSTGLIYFNGCVIKVNQAPMTINSQTMQAYNGTVNLNNYIEANDFPMIEAGNNVIGSEMPLSIVPNYWKL